MAVAFFSYLIDPKAFVADLANTDRYMEPITEMFAKLFCKFGGTRGHYINVLRCTRFANVCIYGLCSEQNRIVTPLQKFKDSSLYLRQWQWFVRHKFLKCQNLCIQH